MESEGTGFLLGESGSSPARLFVLEDGGGGSVYANASASGDQADSSFMDPTTHIQADKHTLPHAN